MNIFLTQNIWTNEIIVVHLQHRNKVLSIKQEKIMEHTMSEYEHGLKDGINMGIDRMKKTLIDQIKHNCSGTEVKKILEIIENFHWRNHNL